MLNNFYGNTIDNINKYSNRLHIKNTYQSSSESMIHTQSLSPYLQLFTTTKMYSSSRPLHHLVQKPYIFHKI